MSVRVSDGWRTTVTWMAPQGSIAAPVRSDSDARRMAAGRASFPFLPINSIRSPVIVFALTGIQVEKRHATGKLLPERIARKDRSRRRVSAGDDVQLRAGPVLAEHPLHVQRHRIAAHRGRVVAERQVEHLDFVGRRHEQQQRRSETVPGVFECGVALAMPHSIRLPAAGRQRGRRPELPCLFVADEDRLTRWIADRIVSPGGEAIVVAVSRPRVARSPLCRRKSKCGMRDDVRPRLGWK